MIECKIPSHLYVLFKDSIPDVLTPFTSMVPTRFWNMAVSSGTNEGKELLKLLNLLANLTLGINFC